MSADRIEAEILVLRTIAEQQQDKSCEYSSANLAFVPRVFSVLARGLTSDEFKTICRDLNRRQLIELRPWSVPQNEWPASLMLTCLAAPDGTPLALVRVLSVV